MFPFRSTGPQPRATQRIKGSHHPVWIWSISMVLITSVRHTLQEVVVVGLEASKRAVIVAILIIIIIDWATIASAEIC